MSTAPVRFARRATRPIVSRARPPTPSREPARIGAHTTRPSPPGRGAGGEGKDASFLGVSRDARIVASLPVLEGDVASPLMRAGSWSARWRG